MDTNSLLHRAIDAIPIRTLWRKLNLPGDPPERDGVKFCSPLRPDQSPSCSIHEGKFHDWSRDEHLDSFGFFQRAQGLDSKAAFRPFVEMAELGRELNGEKPKPKSLKTASFDWLSYVSNVTDADLEELAKWRGLSLKFCRWLRDQKFIGRVADQWAFPVHYDGKIVAAHVRLKKPNDKGKHDWFYDPLLRELGIKTQPLIIGNLAEAERVFASESQWDLFAILDRLGVHDGEEIAAIATRGAGNVGLLRDAEGEIYLVPQNDGAGKNWLDGATKEIGRVARILEVPTEYNDANDWLRACPGAGPLVAAIQNAKTTATETVAAEPSNNGKPQFAKDLEDDFGGELDNDDSVPVRRVGNYKSAKCSIGGVQGIILPSGSVELIDTAALLFRKLARTERFFVKGGIVVELLEEKEIGQVLHPVSPASFCSRIEEYFQVLVWRTQNGNLVLKPTTCPEETAKKLLCTTEALTTLNPIQTVIRCPVAVEGANGEIKILSLGYHNENGGILVVGGDVISDVPLKDAVDGLKSLVDEFDFQTPADRSRAIASLLSPAFAFGQLLKGRMPVDVAEADQSQAGKTFRQKLIAAVYNETPRLIARRDGGVGSLDESFSTAVIQGCPFLQFDNLRGIFDSQLVEAFLTSDRSPIRVPYRGEIVVGTRNFYILMTSNGVETTRDFANRASFVRIRKRTGYRFKRYPEGDLLAHVKANQAYYLGCVFSVIGEWLATGRPSNPDETRHDFREWAQLMDLLLTKLFGEAPLMDDHPAAQERVSNPALNFIRRVCMAAVEDGRVGKELTASDITDIAESHHIELGTFKAKNSEGASRQVGLLLSRAFKESNDVLCEDFRITRETRQVSRDDGRGYFDMKFYCIEKTPL